MQIYSSILDTSEKWARVSHYYFDEDNASVMTRTIDIRCHIIDMDVYEGSILVIVQDAETGMDYVVSPALVFNTAEELIEWKKTLN